MYIPFNVFVNLCLFPLPHTLHNHEDTYLFPRRLLLLLLIAPP